MVADYDIKEAFRKIETELLESMIRNMKNHRAEEKEEGYEWSQWQSLQLRGLEEYKRKNKEKFKPEFKDINNRIRMAILHANAMGKMVQEAGILNAIKEGYALHKKTKDSVTGEFFHINDRKMDALVDATVHDMEKAETAILRMSNDQYRKVIFNAQVYANSGAGTYEKAVDMATKDLRAAGLNCVVYKDGSRHSLESYADMAIRTASKRAYLQGEGEIRKEWGIHTVIMNKRQNPCPLCLPWVGRVLIDDVWSGGTEEESKKMGYPLMSNAVAAGLYHPNCKDVHTTYFEGITTPPNRKWTKEELEEIERNAKKEAKEKYAERQAEKYERMAKYSLDEENKKKYSKKEQEWKNTALNIAQNSSFEDVTQKYLDNNIENKGIVKELELYEVDGHAYHVDGINIKQNNSQRELEVADTLSEKLGCNVELVPEISGKYSNISTPDYIIDGERWDLKELNQGTSKELLRNIVHKKKRQAENFIFDISECKLSFEEVNRQAECIFNTYYNTKHVNCVIIIKNDEVVKILKRK